MKTCREWCVSLCVEHTACLTHWTPRFWSFSVRWCRSVCLCVCHCSAMALLKLLIAGSHCMLRLAGMNEEQECARLTTLSRTHLFTYPPLTPEVETKRVSDNTVIRSKNLYQSGLTLCFSLLGWVREHLLLISLRHVVITPWKSII